MANAFLDFFISIGKLIKKGLSAAKDNGLDDALVESVLPLVREAAILFLDNAERRNYVIKILVAKGVPESVARIALELALQIIKKESK
jgi:hypothetical protein